MGNHTSAFLKITIKRQSIADLKHSIIVDELPSQLFRDDVSLLANFYNDLSTVPNELKNRSLVFLTADWNAKVGKQSNNIPVTIVLVVNLPVLEITVSFLVTQLW